MAELEKGCGSATLEDLGKLARKLGIDTKKQSLANPDKMVNKKKNVLCREILRTANESDGHRYYIFAYLCKTLTMKKVKELAKEAGIAATKSSMLTGRRVSKTKYELCKEYRQKIRGNYKPPKNLGKGGNSSSFGLGRLYEE